LPAVRPAGLGCAAAYATVDSFPASPDGSLKDACVVWVFLCRDVTSDLRGHRAWRAPAWRT